MSLFWKDREIIPGMMLEVDLLHNEVFNSAGKPVSISWQILSFENKKNDEAYFEYSSGKKYPLKKVLKNRKLQAKLNREELLQIPACTDFMVVQEYHDGKKANKRCYNLDMLGTIREIRMSDRKD